METNRLVKLFSHDADQHCLIDSSKNGAIQLHCLIAIQYHKVFMDYSVLGFLTSSHPDTQLIHLFGDQRMPPGIIWVSWFFYPVQIELCQFFHGVYRFLNCPNLVGIHH